MFSIFYLFKSQGWGGVTVDLTVWVAGISVVNVGSGSVVKVVLLHAEASHSYWLSMH